MGFCLLYLPLLDPQARTAAHTDLLDRAQHLLQADLHLPGFESSVQAQKEYCRLKVAVREQSANPLQNTSTCFFVCVHAAFTMQKSLSTNLALGEQASLQEISSQQVAFAAAFLLLHLWTSCDWYAQQGTAHNMISCSGKGSKIPQRVLPTGCSLSSPVTSLDGTYHRQLQVTMRKHDAFLTSVRLLFCRTVLSGDSGALDFLEHLLLIFQYPKHSSFDNLNWVTSRPQLASQ